jgi:CRP/FNR family transcriptional regulator, cyclic AMP receptor protein
LFRFCQEPVSAALQQRLCYGMRENDAQSHPFLRGLSDENLQRLADASMYCQFEPGEVIFREGEPANRFYLIHSGEVELEAFDTDRLLAIQKLSAGEVLGWSWLFEPYQWHFNARATQRTTATFYYATRLREECEQDPKFGYELMKRIAHVLMDRLQWTRRKCFGLAEKR